MKRLVLLAPVLVVLVPASAALALGGSMPKPPDSTVVVPTSIAGVKLGMSEGKARAAWGSSRGSCVTSETSGATRCEYGGETGNSGWAYIDFHDGKVTAVLLAAGKNASNHYLTTAAGALTKIKTAAGIGIGSKFSKLKKQFPKGEVNGPAGEPIFTYLIAAKKGGSFNVGVSGGKIYAFALQAD
ncbi:MAG: hypothetical protein ACOYD4_10650 [Solirubrobacterales bacterium]